MPLPLDVQGWADELRRAFQVEDDVIHRGSAAEWTPPTDVIQHADALEILMDLAGVGDRLQVAVVDGMLVVSGEKQPGRCAAGAAFHVAERTFGRFRRVIPLRFAVDAAGIKATLVHGQLRIVIPNIDERRGRPIPIPIERL
jgi:HSP20 family protein